MKVFWIKSVLIWSQIFLAASLSSIHAMHSKQSCKQNFLNIEQFLYAIKRNFFITSQNNDFKMLKTVLLQYNPNKDGNITGKNLKKLRQNANNALAYWNRNQLYHHMLKEVCSTIDKQSIELAVEKNNDSEVCSICRDNEREVIILSCKHDFCYECLFAWHTQHKEVDDCHHRCPACRGLFHKKIIANIQRDERYKKTRIKLDEKFARQIQDEPSESYSESDWESDWESGVDSSSRCCFRDCTLF